MEVSDKASLIVKNSNNSFKLSAESYISLITQLGAVWYTRSNYNWSHLTQTRFGRDVGKILNSYNKIELRGFFEERESKFLMIKGALISASS